MIRITLAVSALLAWLPFAASPTPTTPTRQHSEAPQDVHTEAPQDVHTEALELLKHLEGFTATAIWDVNAYRRGYGMPGTDAFTREQAEREASERLRAEYAIIATAYPHLTERTRYAVAVFRFNTGRIGADLDAALRSGNAARIAAQMRRWIKSDGVPLDGLRIRRDKEIAFFM